MRPFLPPANEELVPKVVARNARRARRLTTSLRPVAITAARAGGLDALQAVLRSLRGDLRSEFLFGPSFRAWLAQTEEAILLARPGDSVDDLALFDKVSSGPHLPELLPSGRLDRGFRRRARLLGDRKLQRAFGRLPALLAFLTPPRQRFGPFPIDAREDGEEARAAGDVHIEQPVPATLVVRGRQEIYLDCGGVRLTGRGSRVSWRVRRTIEESSIVLARRVVSSRRGLHASDDDPGPGRALGLALRLIRSAWPSAYREILTHTRVVVPLVEKGTVSFSLPERPGVSYINVTGKSLVGLADDLLHETAHHRLHSFEEVAGPLDHDDGEPRYRSPWRRGIRPLHGILHATYTFAWRAELFRKLLALRAGRRGGVRLDRAWLRREIRWEESALRSSLRDLLDAEQRGLLTEAGIEIRRSLTRRS